MSANGTIYTMGIDPGGTSGWAVIGVHERTVYMDNPGRILVHEYGEVTGDETAQVITLMGIASQYHPLIIVCESFTPKKPITSSEYLSPVRIAARIQFCKDTSYTLAKLTYQTPSMAMKTATDERLKLGGLYVPGPDHIKDATRHAITFIRRAKQDKALREAAWGTYITPHQSSGNGRARSRRTVD
jgi:hypothetical protein